MNFSTLFPVMTLPDDTFPLDAISVELNRVFASVHMK